MKSRKEIYPLIFDWFVEEGRELGIKELKIRIRDLPITQSNLRSIVRRIRKEYAHRWHEIYDTNLGVVHTPQQPEPEVMAPEPKPEVDPLAALRAARAQKEEEHE